MEKLAKKDILLKFNAKHGNAGRGCPALIKDGNTEVFVKDILNGAL